jgi:hypothetical protein
MVSLQNNSIKIKIHGRRVVNISYLFQEIKNIENYKHHLIVNLKMIVNSERKFGLK